MTKEQTPMNKLPAKATHIDQEGNFWWISSPEEADGTGEFWTADGWRTSEISSAFLDTLTPTAGLYSLLTYEPQDDPGYERGEYVLNLDEARDHLRGKSDMVVWAELSDMDGNVVAGTEDLV